MPVRASSPHLCEENPAYPRQFIHSIIIISTSARSSNIYKTPPMSSESLHLLGRRSSDVNKMLVDSLLSSLSQVSVSTVISCCMAWNLLYMSQVKRLALLI